MAATADPSAASHRVNLANALREAGQVGPALRAFDAALRIDPGHPLARSNLIYTLDFDSRQDTARRGPAA
ncbi:MAG: tetratricopeptide repeat protein [Sneathiellaceae bacterium]